ncbi:MAG: O-methyltransferase [Lachnospiraceae bacterium]|nr:O-methyltransferase [Lachnospiraceae bacterium]
MDTGRISEFINGYLKEPDELLKTIRKECEDEGVPLIRKETEAFIGTVINLLRPKRILELGTAAGYSSIFMMKSSENIESIDTIEDWEPRIQKAKKNIAEADKNGVINLIEGDAYKIIKGMNETYDLVFIDAAKGQYPEYLKESIRLTNKGAVIIADNIFQDGDLLESKYIVERRNRTIHKRIREFLDDLMEDKRLLSSILPIGDGVTFSIRK